MKFYLFLFILTTMSVSAQDICSPVMGLKKPLAVCSEEAPCTELIKSGDPITTSSHAPKCYTTKKGRKKFNDGAAESWVDKTGVRRYFCGFKPKKNPLVKKAMVLYFHGASSNATDLYNATSLREKAEKGNFVLISVQGRNLHWPNHPDGSHHDIYHRSLGTNSTNPDILFSDYIIDKYVKEGIVNPKKIYTIGWSNGSIFSQMYAIARHKTPTAGGNFVAAGAAYASSDPFNNTSYSQSPSCQLEKYPQSNVPLYLISRACDSATPCNMKQNTKFARPPGYAISEWVSKLENELNYTNVKFKIINLKGKRVSSCQKWLKVCTKMGGLLNHIRWPDGIADKGGIDWEKDILKFFFSNSL